MNRFTIDRAPEKDWWVVADNLSGLVCSFKAHEFNDTQRFVVDSNTHPDVSALALAAREMGDWLRENHYDIIF